MLGAHTRFLSAPVLSVQMAEVHAADLVVGLHGAGLGNVAFARRGVVLLEFKGFQREPARDRP